MALTLKHPVPGAPWGNKFGWRAAIPSIGLPAKGHNGQDFPAPSGTPVLAARAGTVVWSGWDNGSGWGVRLKHSGGYETWYWHLLKQPPVRAGQQVKAGQQIAQVGSTGQYTTGPHLHFGLSLNGVYRDPRPHIRTSSIKATDPLGGIMSFYKSKAEYRKDFQHLVRYTVLNMTFKSGFKDGKGKAIKESFADAMRRLYRGITAVNTRTARIEGEVKALGAAITQMSGGLVDMDKIEKAAREGAKEGAAAVNASEVADLLEVAVREGKK